MSAAVLAGLLLALQPAIPPADRVVDLAGVLSDATEAALRHQLAAHEDATSNQIAVLTVPSLGGAVLEEFATRVFRTWGLGQADRDNGVLLLIAVADREVRIEVGYGLEGALTDATAGSIIRSDLVPRFREGDFDGGTLAAVSSILLAVAGEYQAPAPPADPGAFVLMALMALFPFLHGVGSVRAASGAGRYVVFVLVLLISVTVLVSSGVPVLWVVLFAVGVTAPIVAFDAWMTVTERGRAYRAHHVRKRAAFDRARRSGSSSVVVDGRTYSVPSGSGGGGGFSGGGGSSGGGGASGSW